jgi:hypothetical protein
MRAEVDLHDQNGARLGDNAGGAAAMSAYAPAADPLEARAKERIAQIIAANLK